MDIAKKPDAIWKEYDKVVSYKSTINLYDNVDMNRNFYNGNQWEGLNAPSIDKPVINLFKRTVDYYASMIISDDIAVSCEIPNDIEENTRIALEYITNELIERVLEQTKFRKMTRKFIKNTAIDGDAFLYWRYDPNANRKGKYKGGIKLELLENLNVGFGDPTDRVVDNQPYIIVIQKLPLETVKKMAKNEGVSESDINLITVDGFDYNQQESDAHAVQNYCTLLTKFWKEEGTVWTTITTKEVVIKKPYDTKLSLYPITYQSWTEVIRSYHGISPLTETRPNQIMINKYFMMLNEFVKKLAFPKLLFDQTKIDKWDNRIGALGVNGNPNEAIAVSTPSVQLSAQFIQFVDMYIEKTKEAMGIYDVALGNANPVNTSAIIALQKTASQPLEFQRLEYLQVVEDSVRIIVDIMSAYYGTREVPFKTEQGEGVLKFDFKDLDYYEFNLTVEVGQASYWSEITQIQTLDNMYAQQIIPDAITYLKQLPNGLLKNKQDIIDAIQQKIQAEQEMQDMQMAMQMVNQNRAMQAPVPEGMPV